MRRTRQDKHADLDLFDGILMAKPTRPKKILVLSFVSEPLPPNADLNEELKTDEWSSEADILRALRSLGHHVHFSVVYDDIDLIRREVAEHSPDVIFNLVDEFRKKSTNDYQVAAHYEALGIPYTGCGPRGLFLSKDKELAKILLRAHRIRVPDSTTCPPRRKIVRPARLGFPLIVKTLFEEGSVGIAQASIVRTEDEFQERVAFIHRTFEQPAIVERFIEGREIYAGVLGNDRLIVLPLRELRFEGAPDNVPKIASFRAKWDDQYRAKWKISTGFAKDLSDDLVRKIQRLSRRASRALQIEGYARLDFRIDENDQPFLLEVNPNPFLSRGEDFAAAAEAHGLPFKKLMTRLIELAMKRGPKPREGDPGA